MEPFWVELGAAAYGLVHEGSMVAVLYWEPADASETLGGEPAVTPAGFVLVDCARPQDHRMILECDDWAKVDGGDVLELASRTHFDVVETPDYPPEEDP